MFDTIAIYKPDQPWDNCNSLIRGRTGMDQYSVIVLKTASFKAYLIVYESIIAELCSIWCHLTQGGPPAHLSGCQSA
jgi:hypothetical protein